MKTLVTGGCSGIGKAFCDLYLKESFGSLVLSVNATQPEISSYDSSLITTVNSDLSSYQAGVSLAHNILKEHNDLSSIVFCHGINLPAPITDTVESQFDSIIDTNLSSVYGFFQALNPLPPTLRSVVLTSSFCSMVGGPTTAHYAISKSGIDTLALNLARLYGKKDIRVNSIRPGFVNTRMLASGISESMRDNIILGRAAEPNEIANLIFFLISEKSSYITGQNISIDGGLRL